MSWGSGTHVGDQEWGLANSLILVGSALTITGIWEMIQQMEDSFCVSLLLANKFLK